MLVQTNRRTIQIKIRELVRRRSLLLWCTVLSISSTQHHMFQLYSFIAFRTILLIFCLLVFLRQFIALTRIEFFELTSLSQQWRGGFYTPSLLACGKLRWVLLHVEYGSLLYDGSGKKKNRKKLFTPRLNEDSILRKRRGRLKVFTALSFALLKAPEPRLKGNMLLVWRSIYSIHTSIFRDYFELLSVIGRLSMEQYIVHTTPLSIYIYIYFAFLQSLFF